MRKSSEHYFFRLSDPRLRRLPARVDAATAALQPEVANKARSGSAGDKGLADWDISRDAPYFGIPIPDAPGKYFYVWLDAPIGYLASLKAHLARLGADFATFLAGDDVDQYHFIGKDIVYFHTLFWPAMLKFAGAPYKVPDNVFVHGFITFSGEKMSKSRGTGISPDVYLDLGLNPEWLRYYIAAKLNARVEDLDFNPDDFVARVNSDLVGKYVNIASRAATFVTRHFDGHLTTAWEAPEEALLQTLRDAEPAIARAYDDREFGKAVREIMRLADLVNQYVDAEKPWELAKAMATGAGFRERLHQVCSVSLNAFFLLTKYLAPILPVTAERVSSFLSENALDWDNVRLLSHCKAYEHLITRIDPKAIDALLEGPKAAARRRPRPSRPPARRRPRPRRTPRRPTTPRRLRHRRLRADRPAHRADRQRRARRRRRQAAASSRSTSARADTGRSSPASSRPTDPRTSSAG